MEKTQQERLKKVIHLYLGCELDTNITGDYFHPYGFVKIRELNINTIHDVLQALYKKERDQSGGYIDSDHIYCKPILRSLDDMTEEEIQQMECAVYQFPEAVGLMTKQDNIRFFRSSDDDVRSPFFICTKIANWARKNGFDCDDLIPDGIAINAKEYENR